MKQALWGSSIVLVAALVASLAGCSPGNDDQPVDPNLYKSLLYMTDTNSGKVYTYDPAAHEAASMSIATVAGSAGEIQFFKGVGYVCVGSGAGAGIYSFDPTDANPLPARIGNAVNAQYCAFASSDLAYVTVATDWIDDEGELYSFNPANPSAGLRKINAVSKYAQDAIIGPDGMLYVAQSRTSGEVLKIDPANDASFATFTTGVAGSTGLASGSYNGSAGVFIASTSGYVHFISIDASPGSAQLVIETKVEAPIFPARLLQLPNGSLVATGYGHTYLIDLSGGSADVSELTASGSPFGSLDIAYKDGLVYVPVPDYSGDSDRLYVFGADGAQASYSPISGIMGTGDAVANIAFYED